MDLLRAFCYEWQIMTYLKNNLEDLLFEEAYQSGEVFDAERNEKTGYPFYKDTTSPTQVQFYIADTILRYQEASPKWVEEAVTALSTLYADKWQPTKWAYVEAYTSPNTLKFYVGKGGASRAEKKTSPHLKQKDESRTHLFKFPLEPITYYESLGKVYEGFVYKHLKLIIDQWAELNSEDINDKGIIIESTIPNRAISANIFFTNRQRLISVPQFAHAELLCGLQEHKIKAHPSFEEIRGLLDTFIVNF